MKCKTLALAVSLACAGAAHAQGISDDKVKIGLILDMSGLYSDITGTGLATAVKMAVEDFGGKVNGKPIEVLVADHQNKADIAANLTRQWLDRDQVDVVADVPNSAAGTGTTHSSPTWPASTATGPATRPCSTRRRPSRRC